jgi:hypothetical protein
MPPFSGPKKIICLYNCDLLSVNHFKLYFFGPTDKYFYELRFRKHVRSTSTQTVSEMCTLNQEITVIKGMETLSTALLPHEVQFH